MHGHINVRRGALLRQVESALSEVQPRLGIIATEPMIQVSGFFVLSGSEGPFDEYKLRVLVPSDFPKGEPTVFEIDNRIKPSANTHINPAGDCCIMVWEEWLVRAPDASFRDYLRGPLHDYFLNQWWFEKKGIWRFGERSHGAKGMVEAYADALRIAPKAADVLYYLRLLSQEWPKGHWLCPCGSGRLLRRCHRLQLSDLHLRVPPKMAKRMYARLRRHLEIERGRRSEFANPF